MSEQETLNEGEGTGLPVGAVDIAFLAVVVVCVAVLVLRCRRRGKKELVRSVSVPLSLGRPVENYVGVSGNFLSRMKSTNKKVVVFYGSQTGTAEEFAVRLAKESTRHGMPAMTFDPEECSEWEDLGKLGSEIEGSLAIFCMATYGEGDPTDNAQEMHDWLKTGDVDLSSLNYVVFGLGNKTYEHYNSMGRYVDQRLAHLGATRVYQKGEGDDDGKWVWSIKSCDSVVTCAVCVLFNNILSSCIIMSVILVYAALRRIS
jgi:NADPH-ferrihemoprotein reductase